MICLYYVGFIVVVLLPGCCMHTDVPYRSPTTRHRPLSDNPEGLSEYEPYHNSVPVLLCFLLSFATLLRVAELPVPGTGTIVAVISSFFFGR